MKFTYRESSFDIEGVSQDDYIFNSISMTRSFYEKDLLDYMHSVVKFPHKNKNKTLAIDVGANIGNHSIFMRSFLSDHLIAIEPNPEVLPILRRNLAKNIEDYTIYNRAVGDAEGTATIAVPDKERNNAGLARVLSHDGHGKRETSTLDPFIDKWSRYEIEVSTLDSILEEWREGRDEGYEVSVIKIDVEGMESAVLTGAENTISDHRPNIFVEATTAEGYRELNNRLRRFGYRRMSKWPPAPVYHFAFKPTIPRIVRARHAQSLHTMRRITSRMTRLVDGR
ncbi:MAG: FkbM family methyltransferase [Candidatus Thiosymbion ectosymbiont of Robbea hypermnestra]|nr:FkbM family methyltransferase [Candidatus Thiosymbion ectosymbiont of Robbea hypermnestra]